MGKWIGIDFGCENARASYVDEKGIAQMVEVSEGGSAIPSVVFLDPIGVAVVGATGRYEAALNPECVVERVKNYMGDPNYILNINGQDYSPAAVSSLILKRLVADAEAWLGDEIEGAVITCPAYFDSVACGAIKEAAESVILSNGKPLNVVQILAEPVAAALAYGNAYGEDIQKTVLIYDLGGTFDCTVMKLNFAGNNKEMEIITTDRNHQLGGRNWDECLGDYVRYEFCSRTGMDFDEMKNDPESIQWFSENIEKAKIALTKRESTARTPWFNGVKEKIEITRDIFEAETESLLDMTILLIGDMLAKKGLSMKKDIDAIALVGGASKMPQVMRRLESEYNKPIWCFNPENAVAQGAALIAHAISTESKTVDYSYGIEVVVGGQKQILNLVKCGDAIPAAVYSDEYMYLYAGMGNKDEDFIDISVFKSRTTKTFFQMDESVVEKAEVKIPMDTSSVHKLADCCFVEGIRKNDEISIGITIDEISIGITIEENHGYVVEKVVLRSKRNGLKYEKSLDWKPIGYLE